MRSNIITGINILFEVFSLYRASIISGVMNKHRDNINIDIESSIRLLDRANMESFIGYLLMNSIHKIISVEVLMLQKFFIFLDIINIIKIIQE